MKDLKITNEEYLRRIKNISNILKNNDIDGVLIASTESEPANVRYFTNYTPIFETAGLLINKDAESMLIIGPESESLARDHSIISNIKKLIEFRETSDPSYPEIKLDNFKTIFKEMNINKKLGLIGTNIMTVQAYEGELEAGKNLEIIKADEILRNMRMIKSEAEIALIRKAASIAEKGFIYALERIKPGMSEIQASAECIYGVLSQGAEETGFKIWVLSGKGTDQAIGKSRQKIIKEGEIIQISMGASICGYVASFGRPIIFGKMDSKIRQIIEVAIEANFLTGDLMKPGVKASFVAKKVHDFIRERGFSDYIVYGPAHGIGMAECEHPFVESNSDFKLKSNMTFAIDTFLGSRDFGLRFEDAGLITDYGVEKFSCYRKEVINL